MSDSPITARFEFVKSPHFRVVHGDGVFGGLTPTGDLFLSIYSERFPIPTAIVQEVTSTGELGEEVRSEREGRQAILREVEVGIKCNMEVAKSLVKWLQEKIEFAEQRSIQRPVQPKEEQLS